MPTTSPESTHLVHYFYSLAPGRMTHAASAFTLPAGWIPQNYDWVVEHLTEKIGMAPVITGVTAFDRPTINPDALAAELIRLADALDASMKPALAVGHLRAIAKTIK